eukprot:TRINITY_DN56678_c0_g1_i1.p2 TRINITY_DN56678_c0_g1~~TRINITY_DN56678_c0_g1_i1.p2  ORF type:complete len:242 (+),score=69.53 TRINITY_DN56678_c0_g1_i1:100-726(+)
MASRQPSQIQMSPCNDSDANSDETHEDLEERDSNAGEGQSLEHDLYAALEWNPSTEPPGHAVGLRHIDDQHQLLLRHVNQLAKLLEELDQRLGGGPAGTPLRSEDAKVVAALVEWLVTYCTHYLVLEDKVLEDYAWPGAPLHARHHQTLSDAVCLTHKAVEDGRITRDEIARLLRFLKDWLETHIREDRKYATDLIEKGADTSATRGV